jgi:hypothetical protein
MNKENVLKQIEEKLLPAVKNLENSNASEHDIFPSLLWLLLENNKELQQTTNDLNQKNQKTLTFLKWIIGLCAFQFIGLGVLVAIILTR